MKNACLGFIELACLKVLRYIRDYLHRMENHWLVTTIIDRIIADQKC